ncbi:hypothetical protein ACWGB8_03560 [Kitasatospora sp. NPDC054939]
MTDHRRPLWQPFSDAETAAHRPLTHDDQPAPDAPALSPFSHSDLPAPTPARPAGGRRPLGPGGTAAPAADRNT